MGDDIEEELFPAKLKSIYILGCKKEIETFTNDLIIPITSQKQKILMLRNNTFRPRFVRALGKEGLNFIAIAEFINKMPVYLIPNIIGIKKMQKFLSTINLLDFELVDH